MTPDEIEHYRARLDQGAPMPYERAVRLLDIAERFARIAAILRPLEALEAAATDAPWDLVTCGDGVRYKIPAVSHTESPAGDWVPIAWFTSDDGEAEADNIEPNRNLIAAARNALPALLREIQETP